MKKIIDAFITTSNAAKIVYRNNLKELDFNAEIYEKPIRFFSKTETQLLLAFKELIENPDDYITNIYDPIKIMDSKKFIQPERQPSYHLYQDCEYLNSDFSGYEIPVAIQAKGEEVVEKFRVWFKENELILHEDSQKFALEMSRVFGIEVNLKQLSLANSGSTTQNNYTVTEIKDKIDFILEEVSERMKVDPDYKKVISAHGVASSLAYNDFNFSNSTGIEMGEVKKILKEFHVTVKLSLKKLILEYYRISLNPTLKFKGSLLEALGFNLCANCRKKNIDSLPKIGNDIQSLFG